MLSGRPASGSEIALKRGLRGVGGSERPPDRVRRGGGALEDGGDGIGEALDRVRRQPGGDDLELVAGQRLDDPLFGDSSLGCPQPS